MPWEFNHAKEFSEYPSFLGLGDRLKFSLGENFTYWKQVIINYLQEKLEMK